jgi:hypothetical protein
MIVLSATTDTFDVVLSGAITTNQLPIYSAYRDITTSAYTADRNQTATNSTTPVNAVGAPAASTQRVVDYMCIWNADTVAATVTARFNANGTTRVLRQVTLQVGEALEYSDKTGWVVLDATGRVKNANSYTSRLSSLLLPGLNHNAALTGTKTLTSGTAFAVYVGKAPRSLTSIQLRYRVTTAAATITWAELAIAKGSINVGGNPNLTVVGFADVSAVINSTGQKTTTVNVSSGQSINEGDDLWLIIGNSATTAGVVRALTIADDLQVGVQASVASRPSTIVGTGTAFTIEGATTLAPWIVGIV